MSSEPIAIIELAKLVVNSLVVWIVVMGIIPMTDVQQAATMTLALAIVSLAGALLQRQRTTPVANPLAYNAEGRLVMLVPEDGSKLLKK